MDLLTPLAFIAAVAAVLLADLLDGGRLGALLNAPAMLLVLGGTLGATAMTVPAEELLALPQVLWRLLRPDVTPMERTIGKIAALGEVARREGLLRLEDALQGSSVPPFLRHGLQGVVDGTDEHRLRTLLERELSLYERRQAKGAQFFLSAGGFAPTLGIIGTVVGLVSVLSHLSDVQRIAPAIATAFIATLWGVASANLFWLPISYKLSRTLAQEVLVREMIVEGCVAIAAGRNPRLILEQLSAFGADGPADAAAADEGALRAQGGGPG